MGAKRRGNTRYSRAEAPLGTVRERATDSGRRIRVVKVRMDGPTGLRWIHYARWWWEQNRGAVPQGYRVAHADGDLLNDDPANFILAKAGGEVLQIWHRAHPEASSANYAACRSATAAANVQRAIARRRARWLQEAWYPVDIARRQIHDAPRRKRWQIYAGVGFNELLADKLRREVSDAKGGSGEAARYVLRQLRTFDQQWRWLRSVSLGWPGRQLLAACVLYVLCEAEGPVGVSEVAARVGSLRSLCLWRPAHSTVGAIQSSVSHIRDLVVTRHGGWTLLPAALAERLDAPRIVPVRGRDLMRFPDFARVDHPYRPLKSPHLSKGAA